jgi:triosephosphate isomerase
MFTKSKIAVIALTSTLAFTATAQVENVSLDKYVSVMVNQAMDVAQQELKKNVRSTILTVAKNVSFNEEKSYTANVSITDLKSKSVEVSKTQAE